MFDIILLLPILINPEEKGFREADLECLFRERTYDPHQQMFHGKTKTNIFLLFTLTRKSFWHFLKNLLSLLLEWEGVKVLHNSVIKSI